MMEAQLQDVSREFERDGFVNGGQVLDSSAVAVLIHDLELEIDAQFRRRAPVFEAPMYARDLSRNAGEHLLQMTSMWKVSEAFRELIENARLLEIAAALTRSKTLQVWRDTVQYKPPLQGASFSWHQDASYHISIEPPELLLGAWVALDDADEESGCMWMVPGSHRWGQQLGHLARYEKLTQPGEFGAIPPPPTPPEVRGQWRAAEPCRVRAGEVHFHHALTWHGSPVSQASRPRRGYSIFLMPEGVRVSRVRDGTIPIPQGTLMVEAGPDFPIVYRASGSSE